MDRIIGLSAVALALTGVDAGSCKPVTMIQTRASGSPATFKNGEWSTKFGISNVNLASLSGSFYYVISETIDKETGYAQDEEKKCQRKNGVTYIHFYKVTMCNPDDALWWFGQRAEGVKGDPAFNLGEYGQYVTFDEGTCKGSPFCDYLIGTNGKPNLGQFTGWQDVSTAKRNPTKNSYWYSLPGACPQLSWADKTDECSEDYPSGLCAAGETPNGEKCTWAYEMMGQVNLDELVGITAMKNDAGVNYKNAKEFCLDGKTEFLKDEKHQFVEGLDFWKDPLSETANAARVQDLLDFYKGVTNNKALPTVESLKASNPRCYESTTGCFADGKETCTRNNEMICVPCDEVEGGCKDADVDVDASQAFPSLPEYVPAKTNESGSGAASDDGSGAASLTPLMSLFAGLALFQLFL